MTTAKPSVLFVCVHNAGRSQMAAGWLRHLAGDTIEVRSAGSAPADQINPTAVAAMAEVDIDITDQTPKILTPEASEASTVVITMGCGDVCPYFPGQRHEDWQLTDPAGQPIEVVRQVRDDIRDRVSALVAELVPADADEPGSRPEPRTSHRSDGQDSVAQRTDVDELFANEETWGFLAEFVAAGIPVDASINCEP